MSFPWNPVTTAVGKRAAFMGRSTQIVAVCLWSHPRSTMRSWRKFARNLSETHSSKKGHPLGCPFLRFVLDFYLVRQKDRVNHLNHTIGLVDVRDRQVRNASLFVLDDDVLFAVHHQSEGSATHRF